MDEFPPLIDIEGQVVGHFISVERIDEDVVREIRLLNGQVVRLSYRRFGASDALAGS